ncbi:MAG: hypothetical protein GOU98_04470 [Candidatus Altiarchaeota archaeon]|nr:hypothetical protein [Candidatus Altiarchaeota archaeon]
MPEYQIKTMKKANEMLDRVYGLFEGMPTEVDIHTKDSKADNVPEISIQRGPMGDENEYISHEYRGFSGIPVIDASKISTTEGYTKTQILDDLKNLINSYSDTEQEVIGITTKYN